MTPTITLQTFEEIIERGLDTFVEVGNALMEIRDGRLYKDAGFKSFEDYCQRRWNWSRTHADRQIAAAKVAGKLTPMGVNSVQSERQARELLQLEPEQQAEVASRVDFSTATAEEVREVAKQVKNGALYTSDSAEWYTPPEIVQCVVDVLGKPDLDPCSDGETIPARKHFTQADDGLSRPWKGTVYMNPPYGRGIDEWVEKLMGEHAAGRTTAAIALIPARVDTEWFRKFRDCAVCFISGRLRFSGHENSAPFPSAAVYMGPDLDKFFASFSPVGDVWIRLKRD